MLCAAIVRACFLNNIYQNLLFFSSVVYHHTKRTHSASLSLAG
jgi:hypothetical protein